MVSGNDSLEAAAGSSGPGDLDGFLTILAHERRRKIVRALAEHERGMTPDELAETLLDAEECGRRRLRTELRHRHLPRLEESAFIERGKDGTIYATEWCVTAVDVLDAIEGHLSPRTVV